MVRTILPGDMVLCPLIELKRRPISDCIEPPRPFFIRKDEGAWYELIHCSQLKEIYETDED